MKFNEMIESLINCLLKLHKEKKIDQEICDKILKRLNLLKYHDKDINIDKIPDLNKTTLEDCLKDLVNAIKSLEEKSVSLFMKLISVFYDPETKKLNNLITKLFEITDAMTASLSKNQNLLQKEKLLIKRSSTLDCDQLMNEVNTLVTQQRQEGIGEGERISLSLSSTRNDVNMPIKKRVRFDPGITSPEKKSSAFILKIIFQNQLQKYIERNQLLRKVGWDTPTFTEYYITRSDFSSLPNQLCLKLSRQHAKIIARKDKKDRPIYTLYDLSTNGIHYLDSNNTLDYNALNDGIILGTFKKVDRQDGYMLKHGDLIGLIMRPGTNQNEITLGFQFLEHL